MLRFDLIVYPALLLLLGSPAFAAELLISIPQDEHLDPASSQTMSVRPGDKVSLVAALYDKLDGGGWLDKGRRAEEFHWQPGCDTSSPACPTVTMTPGSVVVTINVPICFPQGTTTFTITMPSPPEGETAPPAARVNLTNTEPPSICPGGSRGTGNGVNVAFSAMNANPSAAAANAAAARGGHGSGGGRSGSRSDPRRDPRLQKAWAEAYGQDSAVYSNGAARGFNYGDPEQSAPVVACGYRASKLRCHYVESPKRRMVPKIKVKRSATQKKRAR